MVAIVPALRSRRVEYSAPIAGNPATVTQPQQKEERLVQEFVMFELATRLLSVSWGRQEACMTGAATLAEPRVLRTFGIVDIMGIIRREFAEMPGMRLTQELQVRSLHQHPESVSAVLATLARQTRAPVQVRFLPLRSRKVRPA